MPCIYHAYTSRHRTAPQISLPLLPLIPNAIATDAPRKEKAGDGEEEEADVPDEKAPLLHLLWLHLPWLTTAILTTALLTTAVLTTAILTTAILTKAILTTAILWPYLPWPYLLYDGSTYLGAAARQVRPRRAAVVAPRQAPPSHGRGGADLPARRRALLVHWAGDLQAEQRLRTDAKRHRAALARRRERGQPGHPDAHARQEQLHEPLAAG